MGLIYLFRRLVFVQVLLGILAFCMAEQNPEMLLIAGALVALSWYVVEGPTGKPLHQNIIMAGALAAVAWLMLDIWYFRNSNLIIAVGHFTMWLQVLQLYGEKRNRDYALLLVLSLLQMVGASVLSYSVVFGALLAVYGVLALCTVLLFQIKSTSDRIMEARRHQAPPEAEIPRPRVVVGRGHRWHLRGMATFIGLVCVAVALVIFILMPRTSRFTTPLTGEIAEATPARQVGFNREINLSAPAPLAGSKEPMLNLTVSLKGADIGSTDSQPWRLRGAALDTYNPSTQIWSRGGSLSQLDQSIALPEGGNQLAPDPDHNVVVEAGITLRTSAQRTLFTLLPITWIESPTLGSAIFNPRDGQLNAATVTTGAVVYRLRSPLASTPEIFDAYQKLSPPGESLSAAYQRSGTPSFNADTYGRGWTVQTPQIRRLALEILSKQNLTRDPTAVADDNDAQIAQALSDYLESNFHYALINPASTGDPVANFLLSSREGHCELFAAGLVAMARSLGMRARVITGYVAHDYNRVGGYYVVRQSDAHAWAEIEIPGQGWRTFDPTPTSQILMEHSRGNSYLTWFRQIYEHVEFAWLSRVIAFDKETRDVLLDRVRTGIVKSSKDQSTLPGWIVKAVERLIDNWEFDALSYSIMAVIILAILVGIVSLLRIGIIRRRRLVALQLTRLPARQRRALSKRLRFYLIMLDMLERRGYHRPSWQTPAGFAKELAEAHPLRFEPVVALTDHFYEIRFGHRDIDDLRRRTIRAHLARLQEALGQRGS